MLVLRIRTMKAELFDKQQYAVPRAYGGLGLSVHLKSAVTSSTAV